MQICAHFDDVLAWYRNRIVERPKQHTELAKIVSTISKSVVQHFQNFYAEFRGPYHQSARPSIHCSL